MAQSSKHSKTEGLTTSETVLLVIGACINIIITLIVAYLLWHEKQPQKWKETLKISLIAFLIGTVLVAVLGVLFTILIIAINPARQLERARQVQQERLQRYTTPAESPYEMTK